MMLKTDFGSQIKALDNPLKSQWKSKQRNIVLELILSKIFISVDPFPQNSTTEVSLQKCVQNTRW